MKTTDLIPLILYQLSTGDKYGYEIVKQIEDSSNGAITIKQPTLYSLLKKLKQGKFITSYWQDSDIGGKRHYYKLTDNGKAQLDTYPAFEQIIADICDEQSPIVPAQEPKISPTPIIQEIITEPTIEQVEDEIKTTDEAVSDYSSIEVVPETEETINPIKIDLTASMTSFDSFDTEVSAESVSQAKFDTEESCNSSSASINIFDAIEPAEITQIEEKNIILANDKSDEPKQESVLSKVEQIKQPEVVAENLAAPTTASKLYSKLKPTNMMQDDAACTKSNKEVIDSIVNTPTHLDTTEKVSYLDYVDMASDDASTKRKKVLCKHIQKMAVTCFSLLAMIILSMVLVSKYSFSSMYYMFATISALILIFYPIILLRNISKLRLQYCSAPFKYSIVRDLFVKLSIFLILVTTILSYNISIVNNVKTIFELSNCANFIAPLMLSSVVLLDFAYSILFYKKYSK